jgi:hypothetical protein
MPEPAPVTSAIFAGVVMGAIVPRGDGEATGQSHRRFQACFPGGGSENQGERRCVVTHKTDRQARVTLPPDFASCVVSIEREGDEIRIRKVRKARRYSFKQLMAGVSKDNIHAEITTGPPVGERRCEQEE